MNQNNQNNKPQPYATIRAGGVRATIWQNTVQQQNGEPFTTFNVNLSRSYKDKQGQWQETNSFNLADLPKAELVMRKAYEHICLADDKPPVGGQPSGSQTTVNTCQVTQGADAIQHQLDQHPTHVGLRHRLPRSPQEVWP